MILKIGNIYKIKNNKTLFFDKNNQFIIKNINEMVLYLKLDEFLDLSKNIILNPTSMMKMNPGSYLYLFV